MGQVNASLSVKCENYCSDSREIHANKFCLCLLNLVHAHGALFRMEHGEFSSAERSLSCYRLHFAWLSRFSRGFLQSSPRVHRSFPERPYWFSTTKKRRLFESAN